MKVARERLADFGERATIVNASFREMAHAWRHERVRAGRRHPDGPRALLAPARRRRARRSASDATSRSTCASIRAVANRRPSCSTAPTRKRSPTSSTSMARSTARGGWPGRSCGSGSAPRSPRRATSSRSSSRRSAPGADVSTRHKVVPGAADRRQRRARRTGRDVTSSGGAARHRRAAGRDRLPLARRSAGQAVLPGRRQPGRAAGRADQQADRPSAEESDRNPRARSAKLGSPSGSQPKENRHERARTRSAEASPGVLRRTRPDSVDRAA